MQLPRWASLSQRCVAWERRVCWRESLLQQQPELRALALHRRHHDRQDSAVSTAIFILLYLIDIIVTITTLHLIILLLFNNYSILINMYSFNISGNLRTLKYYSKFKLLASYDLVDLQFHKSYYKANSSIDMTKIWSDFSCGNQVFIAQRQSTDITNEGAYFSMKAAKHCF